MNFLDSERIENILSKRGFEISNDDQFDIAIVNTCTVTDSADKKCRKEIRNLAKKSKIVLITGCSVKVENINDLKTPKNTFICKDISEISAFFDENFANQENEEDFSKNFERTRKFIEIQNGCDTYCSYCIIPFARGSSFSREKNEIIAEIKKAEEKGFKEIVLTGINLAAWGSDNTNKPQNSKFSHLLNEILKETDIERIRISSIGPEFIDNDFFKIFKNERICDHLHISIQSGSREILKKMKRGHSLEEIYFLVENARKVRKDVALTTDIIVGFPSESDKNFQESISLAKNLKLAKIHVFPYSIRKGTAAGEMQNQIPENIKKERADFLRKIGKNLRENFINSNLKKYKEVLFENSESGFTTNYIRVKSTLAGENEIKKIKLNKDNIIF